MGMMDVEMMDVMLGSVFGSCLLYQPNPFCATLFLLSQVVILKGLGTLVNPWKEAVW